MKKENKFLEFLNSRGFYTALFTCLFAVLAIAAFVSIKNIDAISKLSTYGESDFSALDEEIQPAGVQMDKTVPELTAELNNPKTVAEVESSKTATKETKETKETNTENPTKPQTQVKTEEKEPSKEIKKQDTANESAKTEQAKPQNESAGTSAGEDTKTKQDAEKNTAPEAKAETNTESKDETEKNQDSSRTDEQTKSNAEPPDRSESASVTSFEEGDEMAWPLDGAIVMDFSHTRAIYDKTLDQYRTNPTISISSEVGTQVKAATDGIVHSIIMDPRTGYTVVLDHGNGWQTSYGQLQETILVKEGQTVRKGQAIGGVGTPTKYGVLLGPHLVFGISKDDVPQNPKVVLIENEYSE